MRWPKWGLAGLVALALVAFWILLAGPGEILGIDLGGFGIGLSALVAWAAIHGIGAAPRGELDDQVSPGEWKAWVGLAFTLLVTGYLLAKGELIASTTDPRDLSRIGRNVVLLLIAWAVVSQVLQQRWKDKVLEDERDREIAVRAAGWGRGATMFTVVGIALMLALSPASKLAWASHVAIAHLLVFTLIWGALVEFAVTAMSYWRDRRP
jgi:uncharacterized membrane protein